MRLAAKSQMAGVGAAWCLQYGQDGGAMRSSRQARAKLGLADVTCRRELLT